MAKIKRKGQEGASKSYLTRTHAVRKLQLSLADFRRLCILKGLYPVEPPSRKKANKGSSAPTTFYHAKDIAYLAHEPVLQKLREHKTFAKKLARAVGRREWADAKVLERNEPRYRLDHIIKERYPTFTDALRDLDDALSLIHLFSTLPSTARITPQVIQNCARLVAEWQLYVMRARALRKVFLSIKGVYFEAEVEGERVVWLVPYMFTQHVPPDIDFRILLTFLELYQTQLQFVLFRLYTSLNLVYPPPLDSASDELAAGLGAFRLLEMGVEETGAVEVGREEPVERARGVRVGDVRRVLEGIEAEASAADPAQPQPETEASSAAVTDAQNREETDLPVEIPTTTVDTDMQDADTANQPATTSGGVNTSLFSPYTIYISREVTRPTFEFILRSFGARVAWAPTLGAGSPYTLESPEITHVIMDRPAIPLDWPREGRYYVQPQWVVDCVNAGRVLPEGVYEVGRGLPPHLSPFESGEGGREGVYVPEEAGGQPVQLDQEESEEEEEEEADEEEEEEAVSEENAKQAEEGEEMNGEEEQPAKAKVKAKKQKKELDFPPALLAAAADPSDPSLLRAAELEAESLGMSYSSFQASLKRASKRLRQSTSTTSGSSSQAQGKALGGKTGGKVGAGGKSEEQEEREMAKIMMTNKKRRLYEKMKYGDEKKRAERERLERRRREIKRAEKKAGRT